MRRRFFHRYDKAPNWVMSGLRWLTDVLPTQAKLVRGGTISKARAKSGVTVFRGLFAKLVASSEPQPTVKIGRRWQHGDDARQRVEPN